MAHWARRRDAKVQHLGTHSYDERGKLRLATLCDIRGISDEVRDAWEDKRGGDPYPLDRWRMCGRCTMAVACHGNAATQRRLAAVMAVAVIEPEQIPDAVRISAVAS